MIYWLIVLFVWVICGFISYYKEIKNWDNTKFEKVWFSCVWPVLIPLYIIHYIHNNW